MRACARSMCPFSQAICNSVAPYKVRPNQVKWERRISDGLSQNLEEYRYYLLQAQSFYSPIY